ncbi:hypothetical protein SeMB42_g03770 [Synchytrium endobioticum]|uniref:Uncharacterized protein n=1 Tax=Synchytrium endobioticum TaxID=286115 RepID=A0A507D314_9FUNG|nr:hypothetical protein SeLEV6574_g03632 [Synchytrium endobioticum]TPX46267.1 hypothetical protein SeMB42_g03770 [Synchytrium endobioticum]
MVMRGLARASYNNAALQILVGAVGLGLAAGGFMVGHSLTRDPTVVTSKTTKRENPTPFSRLPQTKQIKLYAVNAKYSRDEAAKRERNYDFESRQPVVNHS